LLARRVAFLARGPDQAVPPMWSARLDLAHTLVLLRDPTAAAELERARLTRPPQMPTGHPLDAVRAYLLAQWQGDAAALRAARAAVEQAYGAEPLRAAALGGVF